MIITYMQTDGGGGRLWSRVLSVFPHSSAGWPSLMTTDAALELLMDGARCCAGSQAALRRSGGVFITAAACSRRGNWPADVLRLRSGSAELRKCSKPYQRLWDLFTNVYSANVFLRNVW